MSEELHNAISDFQNHIEEKNKKYFFKLTEEYINHVRLLLKAKPFKLSSRCAKEAARNVILFGYLYANDLKISPDHAAINDIRPHLLFELKCFDREKQEYFDELKERYGLLKK